jgi:transposase
VALLRRVIRIDRAAARFRVSVKFVNDMVILKRETGGLQPRQQGQWRRTWQAGPRAGLDRGADGKEA